MRFLLIGCVSDFIGTSRLVNSFPLLDWFIYFHELLFLLLLWSIYIFFLFFIHGRVVLWFVYSERSPRVINPDGLFALNALNLRVIGKSNGVKLAVNNRVDIWITAFIFIRYIRFIQLTCTLIVYWILSFIFCNLSPLKLIINFKLLHVSFRCHILLKGFLSRFFWKHLFS